MDLFLTNFSLDIEFDTPLDEEHSNQKYMKIRNEITLFILVAQLIIYQFNDLAEPLPQLVLGVYNHVVYSKMT